MLAHKKMADAISYLCFQVVNSSFPAQAIVAEFDELLRIRDDVVYPPGCVLDFNVTCNPDYLAQVRDLPVWGNETCMTLALAPLPTQNAPSASLDWTAQGIGLVVAMTSLFWVPLAFLALIGLCALIAAIALPFIWLWEKVEDRLACVLGWVFCFPCRWANRKDPLLPSRRPSTPRQHPTPMRSSPVEKYERDSSVTLEIIDV
jgi:hypothetical protein